MNKKKFIAYALAVSTLVGCSKINNSNKKENTIDDGCDNSFSISSNEVSNNNFDFNDNVYNGSSTSMSYMADTDDKKEVLENDNQPLLGNYCITNDDTLVLDDNKDIICMIEKYQKVILLNSISNFDGYSVIQLSDGVRGYVSNLNLINYSNNQFEVTNGFLFDAFNEFDAKYCDNNQNESQPTVYKFVKEDTIIYDKYFNELSVVEKYDIVVMINKFTYDNYAYVQLTDGTRGYINNDLLERLPESFAEVDISEQKVYAFSNNELVVKVDCVTGLPTIGTTPGTNKGYTEVNGTAYGAKLMGGAPSDIFISFNSDGEGFHDARWRNQFGGNIYEYNGSHGCVNMRLEDVTILDKYVKYGTKVLVHK